MRVTPSVERTTGDVADLIGTIAFVTREAGQASPGNPPPGGKLTRCRVFDGLHPLE